jgi:hypothetical protein
MFLILAQNRCARRRDTSSTFTHLQLEELEGRKLLAAAAINPVTNATLGLALEAKVSAPVASLPITVNLQPALTSAGPSVNDPLALATTRLNSNNEVGSIYSVGSLEDNAFLLLPTPFSREAGRTNQPVPRSSALSGTLIGLGESFKGSNDDVTDATEQVIRLANSLP